MVLITLFAHADENLSDHNGEHGFPFGYVFFILAWLGILVIVGWAFARYYRSILSDDKNSKPSKKS